jgi:hypothetical protein
MLILKLFPIDKFIWHIIKKQDVQKHGDDSNDYFNIHLKRKWDLNNKLKTQNP